MAKSIVIKGARVNNLKNISLEIPRDKLVVLTGLSGSGKSSLAFDTLYAEGHRRFVESLSSYARMFLGQMDKPDVDMIEGLSPAISIDQKTTSKNPRSTVGTVTEIYDYLRLLYARVGLPHCPVCGKAGTILDVDPDRWERRVEVNIHSTFHKSYGTEPTEECLRELDPETRTLPTFWVDSPYFTKHVHLSEEEK